MYCSTASTAQHSAISPHKAATQVRADQGATTQASRQKNICCIQVPQAQHSTARSARTKPKASTCRLDCNNASKQTELARARMSSSIYTAREVLKRNEEIEICLFYKNIQLLTQRWCDAPRIFLYKYFRSQKTTLLFLSVLFSQVFRSR